MTLTPAEAIKMHTRANMQAIGLPHTSLTQPLVVEQVMAKAEKTPKGIVCFKDTGGNIFSDRVNINEAFFQVICRTEKTNVKQWITSLRNYYDSSTSFHVDDMSGDHRINFIGIYVLNEPSFVMQEDDNPKCHTWSMNMRALYCPLIRTSPNVYESATNKR